MRWKVFVGLLVFLATGCALAGPPNVAGLRQGKYRVQFDMAASTGVPAAAVGHHDFTFAVLAPTIDIFSFTIVTATLGTQQFYLKSDPTDISRSESLWTIIWPFANNASLKVEVLMAEEANGTYSLPIGCHVLNDDTNGDYVGQNCTVQRAD